MTFSRICAILRFRGIRPVFVVAGCVSERSGALISPLAAAYFADALRRPLRWRISAASGTPPEIAAELQAGLEELERVAKAPRRAISVAAQRLTEIPGELDAEIDTREAAKLLGRTDSRIRQLLRSGDLGGRRVGRFWVTTRGAIIDYRDGRKGAVV